MHSLWHIPFGTLPLIEVNRNAGASAVAGPKPPSLTTMSPRELLDEVAIQLLALYGIGIRAQLLRNPSRSARKFLIFDDRPTWPHYLVSNEKAGSRSKNGLSAESHWSNRLR